MANPYIENFSPYGGQYEDINHSYKLAHYFKEKYKNCELRFIMIIAVVFVFTVLFILAPTSSIIKFKLLNLIIMNMTTLLIISVIIGIHLMGIIFLLMC
jgi:hypothetical protein